MTKKKTDKNEKHARQEGEKDQKNTEQSKKQSSKSKKAEKDKKDIKDKATNDQEVKAEANDSKEQSKKEKSYKEKYEEVNDKYLRLAAEYDNYRKRTLKERLDLTKTAGEDILVNILPVIDDFERALGSIDQAKDIDAVKEGIQLIYTKFKEYLKQRGIKEIDANEKEFDTDLHEAVTKIPAPDEKLKGKVVDVIEKGYYLHEKVIRFSKVVIGE